MHQIRSVGVLGAGVMGAQIAAHAANAGLPVLLLDLDDATAREGLARALGGRVVCQEGLLLGGGGLEGSADEVG